ncbi:hypothetical protein [Wukongibacter sp. M2B1]|uniref:hypothetical protein n=1 Tax=Wukongibacter sp. M2B1 TaxID=3088895 RepID=UPI003D7B8192
MDENSKSKIKYKRLIIIILIVLLALKSYQHFKKRELISIIGEGAISNFEKVNISRYEGRYSTNYDFEIDDSEDITKLIQLIKPIKVRRYGNGNAGFSYNGHLDKITFNNDKRIIIISIYGEEYINLNVFDNGVNHKTYKIIGDIDTSSIDKIIAQKTSEAYNKSKSDYVFSLYDIYRSDKDAYWDYILPNKTHMYKVILSKDVTKEKVEIIEEYVSDPIDDRGEYVERIKEKEIEITSDTITIDGTVVLKAPIEKGNTWDTKIQLTIDKVPKTYGASVTIEEVNEKSVITRLVVPNLVDFKDKEYIRKQIYQKNFGLVYESYNDKEGLRHETRLEAVYKNYISDFIDPREFMKLNDLEVIEESFEKR